MSQAEFIAIEKIYIDCVAATAGVDPENVEILGIDEVSTRKFTAVRLLLATAVRVQTSVLLPVARQNDIEDQSALNRNLNKNGLPSGTLVVQSTNSSGFGTSAPALVASFASPMPESGNALVSNVYLTIIVGSVVGFVAVLIFGVVVHRLILKKVHQLRNHNSFEPFMLKYFVQMEHIALMDP